jgi:hypothetical protein
VQVVPCFEPPDDFTPGMINYFIYGELTPTALSSEIITMAVKGWVSIFLNNSANYFTTKIIRTDNTCNVSYYHKLLDILFLRNNSSMTLDSNHTNEIIYICALLNRTFKEKISKPYFDYHRRYLIVPILIMLFARAVAYSIPDLMDEVVLNSKLAGLMTVYIFIIIGIFGIFSYCIRTYTDEGFILKSQIEGFKLYLSSSSSDLLNYYRVKPPEKTIELYEKFLPYAVTLGVEKEWSENFREIFEKLTKSSNNNVCIWYQGAGRIEFAYFTRRSMYSFSQKLFCELTFSIKPLMPSLRTKRHRRSGGSREFYGR